jgi:hypothetical protein
VHDAEDQHDPVDVDGVEHHPVVTDPKTIESIPGSPDRLDRLAARDSPGTEVACESLQGALHPALKLGRQVRECLGGGRSEGDPVGRSQTSSSSGVVWPLA